MRPASRCCSAAVADGVFVPWCCAEAYFQLLTRGIGKRSGVPDIAKAFEMYARYCRSFDKEFEFEGDLSWSQAKVRWAMQMN